MSAGRSKHSMAVTQLTKTISHDVIQKKRFPFYWQLRLPDTHMHPRLHSVVLKTLSEQQSLAVNAHMSTS